MIRYTSGVIYYILYMSRNVYMTCIDVNKYIDYQKNYLLKWNAKE